ncbi:hypothetical protein Y1Q_0023468 [Alligator mississippiensis]|uniref:Uncharacterized protein n=1 Tax=Alligator mississippiensis TaxID=8496 RepID=A0A151NPM4_ALLMI|nr:hypothetical protein Y1Q_0023468 [Alligator mississippiensis]
MVAWAVEATGDDYQVLDTILGLAIDFMPPGASLWPWPHLSPCSHPLPSPTCPLVEVEEQTGQHLLSHPDTAVFFDMVKCLIAYQEKSDLFIWECCQPLLASLEAQRYAVVR